MPGGATGVRARRCYTISLFVSQASRSPSVQQSDVGRRTRTFTVQNGTALGRNGLRNWFECTITFGCAVSEVIRNTRTCHIAKVGLGRNPAPQRAGAGSRPRQMALKWSKMGYIPFIASQNCLKRNLGRGRTQGSCPLFRSTSSALAQPFDAPTAATAGRGMRPIARTNARTHTRPRFAARCIDLPWSPPRTGPRGGDAAAVLATYDTPRLSAAAVALYSAGC